MGNSGSLTGNSLNHKTRFRKSGHISVPSEQMTNHLREQYVQLQILLSQRKQTYEDIYSVVVQQASDRYSRCKYHLILRRKHEIKAILKGCIEDSVLDKLGRELTRGSDRREEKSTGNLFTAVRRFGELANDLQNYKEIKREAEYLNRAELERCIRKTNTKLSDIDRKCKTLYRELNTLKEKYEASNKMFTSLRRYSARKRILKSFIRRNELISRLPILSDWDLRASGISDTTRLLEKDVETKQSNPKTSGDGTEHTIVSESYCGTDINIRHAVKNESKIEEIQEPGRILYSKIHEIEDSRNVFFPSIDQGVETWTIHCSSVRHGAPEHIFYHGIFETIVQRTRELHELKLLTLSDMIIGRHCFSMSITQKDIVCLKDLNSDRQFRKIGSIFLAKFAKNICFGKEDFRIEEEKSRSFASYIILDMICRKCVMENIDVDEAYPALKEHKGEPIIICVTKKSCLSEYKRFDVREILLYDTSTESLEAENSLDKDDEDVNDSIRRYVVEVNETLSHHVTRLMEMHSNLEAAKVSFVRSTKDGYDYSEPCIVLYCLGKTLVPYGEELFPGSLKHPEKDKAFKTDVREGYYSTCSDTSTSRHQELAMGCNIGEKGKGESATLGPLVEFVESGETGFLTARHLFKPTTRSDIHLQGTEVVQPSDIYGDSSSSSSDSRICGTVVTSHIGDQIDAALINIVSDRVPQRGKFIRVDESDLNFAGFRIDKQPMFDDGASVDAKTLTVPNMATRRIIKVGSYTGLRKGSLSTTNGAVRERCETLEYSSNGRRDSRIIKSQLFVDSYFKSVFCQQGDSGSAVFLVEDDENNTLKCIGMIIGIIMKDFTCVVTPIQNILTILQYKCGQQLKLKEFHFEPMQE